MIFDALETKKYHVPYKRHIMWPSLWKATALWESFMSTELSP